MAIGASFSAVATGFAPFFVASIRNASIGVTTFEVSSLKKLKTSPYLTFYCSASYLRGEPGAESGSGISVDWAMDGQRSRSDDPFLLNYQPSELRIASEFFATWLPFLSKDLCGHCSAILSDRIRSIDSEPWFHRLKPWFQLDHGLGFWTGYESEFIESIVEEMGSKLLDKSASGHGKLIGIGPKLDKLKSIVASESEGVGFIGIWGTGGVGKTTLARAFYEQERERKNFEIHCFLDNIREAWEKEDLISLPRKLLSSLDKKSMEVADFYEGMELIKSKLTDRKILLVLDDVSDIRQLENLAPKKGWFSEGSIIIITTRDKHLLSSHSVSAVYEFKLLSYNESLELFLEKAFKEEHPNEDYLKLARTVIEYARGLPLVLTVLGSSLCKRPIVEWKDELAKLKKIPPKDILKILQVSFDGLDDQQKTIFLDVACFFNGMDKDHVIQILETLDKDFRPETEINVLIKKSLMISYEGHLWVHQILQDMCKYIVYQESHYDAGKRSRILSLEDANQGTEAIRGIALTLEKSCDAFWDPESFSKMSCSKVRKLPEFGKDMACLSKLDLEKTALAKLPQSLGNLIGLVELNLTNCKKLVCLPCSVSKLKALKVIKISECSKLSWLPESLNENEALEQLHLSGIAIQGLSFSDYNSETQSSSSWSCLSLLQRPSSSKKFLLPPSLSFLKELNLRFCNLQDGSLPDDISMLSSLEFLDLTGNDFIDLPSGLISSLSKLKEVDGTYSHSDDKAACGGVLKDGNNCMKEAFLLKLSGGDTLIAKLWGCLMGLKRAWDTGIRVVVLRSDSAEAVRLIKFEVPQTHKNIGLIMEIKGMLERKWFADIRVFHRDGNGIADLLSKRALNGAMA
ncbi:TMV resistance protein N-like [Neltuma alba]|uniref:TMV resistance protein N-like n=1 Tax=Neltuma alba TaxID=207710 RepID=UPI0010A4C294|nr:TMV resistance protein N-like [Prosopis alba]